MGNLILNLTNMPHTTQGLLDYIRFAQRELKGIKRKEKNLLEAIKYCQEQLTIKGVNYATHI